MNKVVEEVKDLEKFIENKVEEKVKMASSKWSAMGTKQKMDFVFVACGIVAFVTSALASLKKLRGGCLNYKRLNNTLLVVFGLIIVYLVWQLYNGQVRLNSFKNEISKLDVSNQYFKETLSSDSIKIASQKQIILSQKDAIRLGVLEVDNLKKVKSQVRTITKIKLDSVFIAFKDTLLLTDTIYNVGVIKVPKRFEYNQPYFNIQGIILQNNLLIDSLKLHNDMKLTIGNKRNGIFKKSTPIVKLTNTNPYMTTLDMNNVIIQKDKKFFDRKVFWCGVGVLGTLIILK